MIDSPFSTNGRAHHQTQGRMVPDLPEIRFPGSGKTAQIRKVGEATKAAILKAARKALAEDGHIEPKPPIIKVHEIYDDPTSPTVEEENDQDPAYLKAAEEYNNRLTFTFSKRLIEHIIKRCLVFTVDYEAVARIRQEWAEDGLEVEAESDEEVYRKEILMPLEVDVIYLSKCATEAGIPTEEDVALMLRQFQSYLQRQRSLRLSNAAGQVPSEYLAGL